MLHDTKVLINYVQFVRWVPVGRVTSYGAIATYLGAARSARMVGWAMNSSFTSVPPVPAHRVVNRNGDLSGRLQFETPTKMQELLEAEGVVIKNDWVVDFAKVFWNPTNELNIVD